VWSIGVITYILLSGKPPFFGINDEEIKKSVCEDELIFREDSWKQVSPIAKDFIRKLLDRNPDTRYTANKAL
jgi:calcium-dependent protein kinase